MKVWAALLAGVVLCGATVPTNSAPIDPAQAIMMADESPKREVVGLFRMKVAAVGRSSKITFLNSNPDYRSAGNVSISLSQAAARALAERSGVADPQALVGRTVVVAGRLLRSPIVNVGADNRTLGFNRWSYTVRVSKPQQLVSITAK